MSLVTVFKSRAPNMGYCLKSGNIIYFRDHIYTTTAKAEIAELTAECEADHPNYYIDPEQVTVDSEQLDPMAVLTARIREEERAKIMAAVGNPLRDMGKTEQGKLEGISNSHSISGLQAASEAQSVAARTTVKIANTSTTK